MLTESGAPSLTAIIVGLGIIVGLVALGGPLLRGMVGTAFKHPLGAFIGVVILAAAFMFFRGMG